MSKYIPFYHIFRAFRRIATQIPPAAAKYYETKGITQKDLESFRKNSDPQQMVEVSQTIAQKVAECYTAAVGTTEGQ